MKFSIANNHLYRLTAIFPIILGLLSRAATAQVVPDATLPNNTIVQPNGNVIEIKEGTTAGTNLFHSFNEFSIPTDNTAFFNNASNIENIIGRITGGSISSIDGMIRANGGANLFLINPNGIVFGENAALDIGGSFIGSTANSIKFADDSEFSAVNPDAPSLLTVNIPVGLQYGNDRGNITVKGIGHNAFFDFDTFTVDRFQRDRGLEVATGNTIGLIGNNISLEAGNLTAEAGNIELGAVAEAGQVKIIPNELGWTFDYGELDRGDINLADTASIDVSGNGSGNIKIYGNEVNLTDGSAIFAETEGNRPGKLTKIDANELNIIGTDSDILLPSSIWSDVYLDATGDGGSVLIETGSLRLEAGGQVNTNTFSLGNAGNLTVRANDIEVIGESEFGDFISALSAQADIFLTGKGGDILVETNTLSVSDGAQIATTTFGEGNGGNLTVRGQEINLVGDSEFGASGLFTATEASGDGGNLIVETKSLAIADGAKIVLGTSGSGNAGTLNIAAEDISLSGDSEFFGASGIFGSAIVGIGNGGNLNIDTGNLSIQDSATINASNFSSSNNAPPGQGKAGNINIKANSVQLDNTTSEFASSITASTNNSSGGNIEFYVNNELTLNNNSAISGDTRGDGDGGNIVIKANGLKINNQARVSVDSTGLGNAGNIEIAVNNLNTSQGKITAISDRSGGGDIKLVTDFINLRNNSEISTSVNDGTGGGGNIIIESRYVLGRDNSDIRANAVAGDGGNINITTDVILLSKGSEVDASSEFGLDGVVEIDNLDLNKQLEVGELPTNIIDPTALIAAICPVENRETLVTTGKGGLAENPRQNLRGESVWEDLRDLADVSQPTNDSAIIEAKVWNINQQGKVELLSYIPQTAQGDYWASFNQCRY